MSRPPIRAVDLSNAKLAMHLCHRDSEHREGFWLYDKDASMNLAMGAPSEIAALVEGLDYWKKRALRSEAEHATLHAHVAAFVAVVDPRDPADGEG